MGEDLNELYAELSELKKDQNNQLDEIQRRIAIAKKEKEIEDLRNGKTPSSGFVNKLFNL